MKHIIRIALLATVIFILHQINYMPSKEILNTLFAVVGIFFSIGYSISISFNFEKITNNDFLKIIKRNLQNIQNTFIVYFTLSSTFFVLSDYIENTYKIWRIDFSFKIAALVVLLYTMIYLIYNFRKLQTLKNDISDKIRAQEKIK